MKQVLVKKGQIIVEDVPPPLIDEGSVLVEVKYSLISVGTETAGVEASGKSVLQKALKQPEKVKQVLNMVKTQGFSETIDKVKGKLESANPTGYSCAGVVINSGIVVKTWRYCCRHRQLEQRLCNAVEGLAISATSALSRF